MALEAAQHRQIQDALLAAFSRDELRRAVKLGMGVAFDAHAAEKAYEDQVFAFVGWVDRQNRAPELIATAYNANPGSQEMQGLVHAAQPWPVCSAAGFVIMDGRASVFAPPQKELAYLDAMLAEYASWAELYTPLAGIADVAGSRGGQPRRHAVDAVMPPEFARIADAGLAVARQVERVTVDDLRQAIHERGRLVVLGEPGAGKTTTLRVLLRDYALAAKEKPGAPLPLLVALGGYAGDETALEYAAAQAGDLGPHLPAYLHAGRAILLLDALNEMPRSRVARVQALLDRFRTVPVVVTCRALDYDEALKLQKLAIEPLDRNRQRAYLHRYLGEEDGDTLFWRLTGGEDVMALWRTWEQAGGSWEAFWQAEKMPEEVYKRTTTVQDGLWRMLRDGKLSSLLELSANPYMLAMLIQIYREGGGDLPLNRAQLFAMFATILCAREEARRQKSGAAWPGTAMISDALASLAFAMQESGERGTAVAQEWAMEQLRHAGCSAEEALYLGASATLLDISNKQVRFVHQLLQEYFAAVAWQARFEQGDDLRTYWPAGWVTPSGWEETAVLLAGMLPEMTAFVEQLLPVNPALAARCIVESGGTRPNDATIGKVQQALAAIATSLAAPVAERNAAGNALNFVGDPRPGVGLKDGLPDIAWCGVPADEFLMGNMKATDEMAYDDEAPQHRVFVDGFRISKYPITNTQFQAFVDDGGYTDKWQDSWTAAGWAWKTRQAIQGPRRIGGDFDQANHPVVGVSWYEAVAFCNWLTKRVGKTILLPGEVQWEKAARGTDGRRYPWGPEITPEHANYNRNIEATTAVGVFPMGESPYGLLDAAGNVWEWTATKWVENYENYRPDDRLEGGARRMLRGGAWFYSDTLVRCAYRNDNEPDSRYGNVGFRVMSPGF